LTNLYQYNGIFLTNNKMIQTIPPK